MTTEAVAHQRQVRHRLVNRCCPFAGWHEHRRDPGGLVQDPNPRFGIGTTPKWLSALGLSPSHITSRMRS